LHNFHNFGGAVSARHSIRSTKGMGGNNIPVLLVLK